MTSHARRTTDDHDHVVADVLAAWRTAERKVVALAPASEGRARAEAEVARLRALYQRLVEERVGHETSRRDAADRVDSRAVGEAEARR